MKLYGSIDNRFEENRMFTDTIEVGTKVTEYLYTDRHVWEVIAVQDQKHVTIRRMKAIHVGGPFENKWELESDENGAVCDVAKRGNYWYMVRTCTKHELERVNGGPVTLPTSNMDLFPYIMYFDVDKVLENGKQTKYTKMNLSFGVADYYYDYEF